MGITYGYVRVSSADQKETRQLDILRNIGIDTARIYVDKQSGKDFNRPAWRKLVSLLHEGDLLIIQSLDRMGRNYAEIKDEWRHLVRDIGIDVKVLNMPLLDTTNKVPGLIGRFVADIVLEILAFVAENERQNIKERQRQGIASAMSRGTKFGAPIKVPPQNFNVVLEQYKARKISLRKASHACHVSRSTFKKWIGQKGGLK